MEQMNERTPQSQYTTHFDNGNPERIVIEQLPIEVEKDG